VSKTMVSHILDSFWSELL